MALKGLAMKTVSAREANQGFSRLLAAAAAGEEIVITRRGMPVAKLVPVTDGDTAHRRAAQRQLLAALKRGAHLGGIRTTRDEMHER